MMRGCAVGLLASALLATALPARAKGLKAAPADPEVSVDLESVRVQSKIAAADPILIELRDLAAEEARGEDLEGIIPRRDDAFRRLFAITGELDRMQKALVARNRGSWILQATLVTKDMKDGRKPDVRPKLAQILDSEGLNERIGAFWDRFWTETKAEQKAFDEAKARAEAARHQKLLYRRLAAGGGGAALLLLLAALLRRGSRPPMAALLVLPLAAATAVPARAKPLAAAPLEKSSAEKPAQADISIVELKAKLAAAEATLQEFRALVLKEARSDDAEALASERDELIARHGALCGYLDPAQQKLSDRIRVDWLAKATLAARDTLASKKMDISGQLGYILEEEELNKRIEDFWLRRRAELESEQKAFGLVQARAEAARRQKLLHRRLAAGGAAAAVLLLLAAAYRRRRR